MSDIIDAKEVSRLAGISMDRVYKMTAQRKIPHRKIGGKNQYFRSKIEQWLKSCEVDIEEVK